MVGDDMEADVRGAHAFGMRTALVRTGKFRPDTLERLDVTPDVVLSSVADLPDWLERSV
jgi:ribonucleotide monophosphatase NagD (HAD superfamily)